MRRLGHRTRHTALNHQSQKSDKPIQLDDLTLRKEVSPERLKDRFELLKEINGSMSDLKKALGSYAIDPDTTVLNHLNQPRELVKGKPVVGLWG